MAKRKGKKKKKKSGKKKVDPIKKKVSSTLKEVRETFGIARKMEKKNILAMKKVVFTTCIKQDVADIEKFEDPEERFNNYVELLKEIMNFDKSHILVKIGFYYVFDGMLKAIAQLPEHPARLKKRRELLKMALDFEGNKKE